jgi:hypothetical protein
MTQLLPPILKPAVHLMRMRELAAWHEKESACLLTDAHHHLKMHQASRAEWRGAIPGHGLGSLRDPRMGIRAYPGEAGGILDVPGRDGAGIGAGSQREVQGETRATGDRRGIPGLQQPRVQIRMADGQGQRAGGAGSADLGGMPYKALGLNSHIHGGSLET